MNSNFNLITSKTVRVLEKNMNIKCVSHLSKSFRSFFIFLFQLLTLKMRAETVQGLHVKCPLLSLDQSWNVSSNFNKTPQYRIL